MTFIVILAILMALMLLGTGVLLLISNKWLPKMLTLMWSTPTRPSAIFRIGVWKLRTLGIFDILASISLFIGIAAPSVSTSLTFIFALMLIALIANVLLGWVMLAFPTKNKKAGSKKL